MKNNRPYILIDLDGTLAEYTTWKGIEHIGEPVQSELEFVKGMIAADVRVKIFTARVNNDSAEDNRKAIMAIRNWLEANDLPRNMEITNMKDWQCIGIRDNIAFPVVTNTGMTYTKALNLTIIEGATNKVTIKAFDMFADHMRSLRDKFLSLTKRCSEQLSSPEKDALCKISDNVKTQAELKVDQDVLDALAEKDRIEYKDGGYVLRACPYVERIRIG